MGPDTLVRSTPVVDLPPLDVEDSKRLRPLAILNVVISMLCLGVYICLQPALLPPVAALNGRTAVADVMQQTFTFIMMLTVLTAIFKAAAAKLFGRWVETRLGSNRPVRLRHAFRREVRMAALKGGLFSMVQGVLIVALAPMLAPAALASARAAGVAVIGPIELKEGILKPTGRRWWMRFVGAIVISLVGSGIVIFAGGFNLFPQGAGVYLVAFLVLIVVGNWALARSEVADYQGVHKPNVAATVYIFARFMLLAIASVVAVVVCGVLADNFGVAWATIQMLWEQRLLFVLAAVCWGASYLLRMCVKTVLSSSFMAVIMSMSVMAAAFAQSIARMISPEMYQHVHSGAGFLVVCALGAAIITLGAALWPHPKSKLETAAAPG